MTSEPRVSMALRVPRNLVATARLENGQFAWPLAEQNGVSRTAFAKRLRDGMSPDAAATLPLRIRANQYAPKPANFRGGGALPVYLTSDGRSGLTVAAEMGISKCSFHSRIRNGWSVDQAAGIFPAPRDIAKLMASGQWDFKRQCQI